MHYDHTDLIIRKLAADVTSNLCIYSPQILERVILKSDCSHGPVCFLGLIFYRNFTLLYTQLNYEEESLQ